jgi:hypothetical protein
VPSFLMFCALGSAAFAETPPRLLRTGGGSEFLLRVCGALEDGPSRQRPRSKSRYARRVGSSIDPHRHHSRSAYACVLVVASFCVLYCFFEVGGCAHEAAGR